MSVVSSHYLVCTALNVIIGLGLDKKYYYPYITNRIYLWLIVTYSPKYAAYKNAIRDRQVEKVKWRQFRNLVKIWIKH